MYKIFFTDCGKNPALSILNKMENTEIYKCHDLIWCQIEEYMNPQKAISSDPYLHASYSNLYYFVSTKIVDFVPKCKRGENSDLL